MSDSGWNMYVFRDGHKEFRGAELKNALVAALTSQDDTSERLLTSLVAAGELECAIADAAGVSSETREAMERISDEIALAFVSGDASRLPSLERGTQALLVPEQVSISVHEGFAYYALHPAKFVNTVNALINDGSISPGQKVGVVGIRSIGAPLSAVTAAALRARGCDAQRVTVRPDGHPYNRQLASESLRAFVHERRGGKFIIVDEGPGMSGSSFLSAAENLIALGVPAADIILIGTRETDGSDLQTENGAERWRKFRFICVQIPPLHPKDATVPMSGGTWRRYFLKPGDEQPSCWPSLELCKFLNYDHSKLFKFQGYGHFGAEVAARARKIYDNGFGVRYLGSELGFGMYEVVPGRMLTRDDIAPELIERIAQYCAFRSREFKTSAHPRLDAIREMTETNWHLEFNDEPFGTDVPLDLVGFECVAPVIVDGRMMAHEWLVPSGAPLSKALKLDAVNHGDDHFFPGPCDIAWDLAGMIVEWELSTAQADQLLRAYERHTGDDARPRLRNWLLAYAAFRMGWCKMAAQASREQWDEHLLLRDYRRFRHWIVKNFVREDAEEAGAAPAIVESSQSAGSEAVPAA